MACLARSEDLLRIKRSHWAIENKRHWTLDVTFKEDNCRARLENAPENLNILRKQALQRMKQENTVKGSMYTKRHCCSDDIFCALKVVGVNGFSYAVALLHFRRGLTKKFFKNFPLKVLFLRLGSFIAGHFENIKPLQEFAS